MGVWGFGGLGVLRAGVPGSGGCTGFKEKLSIQLTVCGTSIVERAQHRTISKAKLPDQALVLRTQNPDS